MPRVTVIMATYNWSTVLPYSIGSALRQTFADFELLVVGDGCTDDSESVVAAISDPRVRWINLPENTRHQSGPNNEGLRQARGEIIAYLGHDDLWFPHHLDSLVKAIDEGADLVSALVALVLPAGKVIPFRPTFPPRWLAPSSLAHRRSVIDAVGNWRHYTELRVHPEEDLVARILAGGFKYEFNRRLSVIKFPAALRRNVYKTRPSDEQATWLKRIETEPELEVKLLSGWMVNTGWALDLESFRDILKVLGGEMIRRIRRRVVYRIRRTLRLDHDYSIRRVRRFKGLEGGD